MKSSNLLISDKKISFKKDDLDINPFFKEKNFEFPLEDLLLIGIKGGVFFDDDYLVITLITKKHQDFYLPPNVFTPDIIKKLNTLYGFSFYDEINNYKKTSDKLGKIIFPRQFYGKPIFKETKGLSKAIMFCKKMLFLKNYASSNFSKIVLEIKT